MRKTVFRSGTSSGALRLLPKVGLALALGLGSGSSVLPIRAAFAQSYAFSAIKVEGNERVDAATIVSYAKIARGQGLSAGDLNDAYQRINASGLFETVELVPQGGTLVIRVREYPMINIVDFEGNKRIKDEALKAVVRSKSRLVFNPAQVEADAAAISEAYAGAGRLAATVEPKMIRRDGNRVDLVFEIAEGRVVENEGIAFVGNRAYSDNRLRRVIASKQAGFLRDLIKADTYDSGRLEVDKQMLRDFYMARGYIDVDISDASGQLAPGRDATFLTYTIREGLSYSIGTVTTRSEVEGIDAEEFGKALRLRKGVTYSPLVIDNNVTRLENLALKKGLDFIRVEPVLTRNQRDQTLDVEFVISKGERVFVERIDIEGNATTLDQVIRRQFRTVEGDPFNPREIRNSAERIRALGHFSKADVETKPGSASDQVVVDVNVEEKPTGKLTFGATFGTTAGFGLIFGFSETNFLGRGQAFSVNISNGKDTRDIALSFTEPAFLNRDLKLSLDAFAKTTKKASTFYDTDNLSFSPSLQFSLGDNSRLELRYRYFQDRLFNLTGTPSPILTRDAARGTTSGSSLGYTYTYDSRQTAQDPKNVFLFRFGQDYAGFGGDAKFVSSSLLAMAETKVLQEEVTLRAIVEGGAVTPVDGYVTRTSDRFFGNGKIRGFQRNGLGPRDMSTANKDALGGNFFAVARLEADFPLGLPTEYGITGGMFYDIGSVWSLNDTNGGLVDDGMKLRSVVGASLFWSTPVGPLRFNFSKALQKESYDIEQPFEFTISTKF